MNANVVTIAYAHHASALSRVAMAGRNGAAAIVSIQAIMAAEESMCIGAWMEHAIWAEPADEEIPAA